jgi:prepilin-type N-terminal cleavage/methylation domain-containing protein
MNQNQNQNQDKGFTLVELLIVIVILGILATVTVFAVRGITDRGQANACSVEAKTVLTAAEAYYSDNQAVAPDVAALFTAGYLGDNGAAANWEIAENTGTSGATVTILPLGTAAAAPEGDCTG